MHDGKEIIKTMFDFSRFDWSLIGVYRGKFIPLTGLMIAVVALKNPQILMDKVADKKHGVWVAAVIGMLFYISLVYMAHVQSVFLYFQF